MTSPHDSSSFDYSMDLFEDSNEETSTSKLKGSPDDTIKFVECPFCEKAHLDQFSLQLHVETNHPDVDSNDIEITSTEESTISSQSSLSSDRIYNGFEDNHRYIVCPYCDVSHEGKEQLANHLTLFHVEDVDHKALEELTRDLELMLCPLCRFICSAEAAMQRHIEVEHEEFNTRHQGKHVLSNTASGGLGIPVCPVCGLEESDLAILISHIELHFDVKNNRVSDEDSCFPSTSKRTDIKGQSSSSSSVKGSKFKDKRKGNRFHYKHQYQKELERAVTKGKISPEDYHEQIAMMKEKDLLSGKDDGHSKVEGMIEELAYSYSRHSRQNQRSVLCGLTDYYCTSYGDKGWGCGYRNFQMMLSCLSRIPIYSQKIFPDGKTDIPSIIKVQKMIETAWQKGFDLEGCLQLEGKLVNTCKWIGATEIVATLSSIGVRCELVDFPQPSSPEGIHPLLFQWVRDYFCKDQEVRPPLYLQHQGHSRTIVGVEIEKETTRLLLFDPGSSHEHITSLKAGPLNWKQIGSFRRNLAAFKAKQYQIVSVVGLLSKTEYEKSKKLTSTRIL